MSLLMRFILLALSLFSGVAVADEITGKVVKIADADTITVLDASNTQHKIRFEGIDAPERGQAYGSKATDALKGAIDNKPVRVVVSGKDRYQRNIGTVYVGEKNLNQWLVANGWAWHYKAYSKDQKLAKLELAARKARVGLWADSSTPMAPWDYRASKRQQNAIQGGEASPVGWWLNTKSNVRHNSTCRYYQKTSKGRDCDKDEGKGCGICGG